MKSKSFTLIELLVVIVIIGILAGLIIVSTVSSISEANIAKSKVFSENTKNDLMLSLVSEWGLDNSTVDYCGPNDATWGGSGGSNTSAKYLSEGECISRKCLDFDGYDDYLSIPYNSSLSLDEATISFWIKLTSDPNTSSINNWRNIIRSYSGSSPFYLYLEQDKNVNFSVIVSGVTYRYLGSSFSGETLSVGKWTFLTYSYGDDGYGKSYKDAVLSRSGKMKTSTGVECSGGVLAKNTSDLIFSWASGTSTPSGSGSIPGIIDEIKLYEAPLNQSQIKYQYVAGLDSLLSKNLISLEEYNEKINSLASN